MLRASSKLRTTVTTVLWASSKPLRQSHGSQLFRGDDMAWIACNPSHFTPGTSGYPTPTFLLWEASNDIAITLHTFTIVCNQGHIYTAECGQDKLASYKVTKEISTPVLLNAHYANHCTTMPILVLVTVANENIPLLPKAEPRHWCKAHWLKYNVPVLRTTAPDAGIYTTVLYIPVLEQ